MSLSGEHQDRDEEDDPHRRRRNLSFSAINNHRNRQNFAANYEHVLDRDSEAVSPSLMQLKRKALSDLIDNDETTVHVRAMMGDGIITSKNEGGDRPQAGNSVSISSPLVEGGSIVLSPIVDPGSPALVLMPVTAADSCNNHSKKRAIDVSCCNTTATRPPPSSCGAGPRPGLPRASSSTVASSCAYNLPRPDPIYPFCRTTIHSQCCDAERVIETVNAILYSVVADVASDFDSKKCSWDCKALDTCGAHVKFVIQLFQLRDGMIVVEWQRRLGNSPLFATLFKECRSALSDMAKKQKPPSVMFSLTRTTHSSPALMESAGCTPRSPSSTCPSPPHSPVPPTHHQGNASGTSAVAARRNTIPASVADAAALVDEAAVIMKLLVPPPIRLSGGGGVRSVGAAGVANNYYGGGGGTNKQPSLFDDDEQDECRSSKSFSTASGGTTTASATSAATVVSIDKEEFSRACVSLKDWVRHDPQEALPAVSRLLPDIVAAPKSLERSSQMTTNKQQGDRAIVAEFSCSQPAAVAGVVIDTNNSSIITTDAAASKEEEEAERENNDNEGRQEQEPGTPRTTAMTPKLCSMRSLDSLDSLCLALCEITAAHSALQQPSVITTSDGTTAAAPTTRTSSPSKMMSPSSSRAPTPADGSNTSTAPIGGSVSRSMRSPVLSPCASSRDGLVFSKYSGSDEGASFFVEEAYCTIVPAALSVIAAFLNHYAAMECIGDVNSGGIGAAPIEEDPTRAATMRCFVENAEFRTIVANAATLLGRMSPPAANSPTTKKNPMMAGGLSSISASELDCSGGNVMVTATSGRGAAPTGEYKMMINGGGDAGLASSSGPSLSALDMLAVSRARSILQSLRESFFSEEQGY